MTVVTAPLACGGQGAGEPEGSGEMSATNGTRIPLRDTLWLTMDRPDNLMYINSLVWFAEIPDWDSMTATISDRMIEPYPVFRRVPARRGRRWFWEDDPHFDISDNVNRSRLPEPGGRAEAEAYVSERMSAPLPHGRPLWCVEYVEGYRGHGGDGEGALVLFRVQHGVVDGVRLSQLILALCDHDESAAALPKVGRARSAAGGPVGAVVGAGAGVARDSLGIARGLGGAAVRLPSTLTRLTRDVVAPGGGVTRIPTRVVDSITDHIAPDNTLANTYRSVFNLLMEPRSPELAWSGHAHARKKVSWISGLDLQSVKRVARIHDTTVTTVMIAAVSRALTEYLEASGERPVADINLMVPMSVAPAADEPASGESAAELGNHITLILLRLPLGIDDPQELIHEVATSMTRADLGGAARRLARRGDAGLGADERRPVARDLHLQLQRDGLRGIATDAVLVPEPGTVAGMIEEQFARFPGWDG